MTTKCKGCEAPATINGYCLACWQGHGEADTLDDLERLCKAAADAPWEYSGDAIRSPQYVVVANSDGEAFDDGLATEDAEFIAAARNNLPWMIERIRELELLTCPTMEKYGRSCEG